MSRKRMAVFGALLLGGLVAGSMGGYAAWDYTMTPEPGVTPENFYRLRLGMTPEQVVAVMGRPPHHKMSRVEPWQVHTWSGEQVTVEVQINPDGVVETARMKYHRSPPIEQIAPAEPFLDTLRHLLHLCPRRSTGPAPWR